MTPSYFTDAITLFSGKVKLFILDDDISLCKLLSGIFTSPLFNISTATDIDQAFTAIGKPSNQWHCWIVDVDLGNGQTALRYLNNGRNSLLQLFYRAFGPWESHLMP